MDERLLAQASRNRRGQIAAAMQRNRIVIRGTPERLARGKNFVRPRAWIRQFIRHEWRWRQASLGALGAKIPATVVLIPHRGELLPNLFIFNVKRMPEIVPTNDLQRLYERYAGQIEPAVVAALRSGWWLNGENGRRFSESFAAFVGVSECVPVANGTDALELALRAVGLRAGSERNEVVTVANAGGYTATACHQIGVVPVYVDIDVDSQLMSLEGLEAALSERTAAVVATHLYGGTVDVPGVRALLDEAGYRDVKIVEDCAQAHGATVRGVHVGAMGDIAAFSFYPSKNLGAMGDAGCVVTSDSALAKTVRMLQQYGWGSKYKIDLVGGRNSRMDEIQAAILSILLGHLDELNVERARIVHQYRETESKSVRFLSNGEGAVIHLAVALVEDRAGFRSFLDSRKISSDVHYPILDVDQPAWLNAPKRVVGDLGNTRRSVKDVISLPCFPGMKNEEVTRVVDALKAWSAR